MTIQQAKRAATAENLHLVETGLQAAERAMYDVVDSEVEVLRDASRHILGAGGKRIRPRLLLLSYVASGGENVEQAAAPAAAVELMHTASVVHDDINDHGVVRRGRPSINSIWGRTFALLTGDFLFTAVYQLLAPYGDLNTVLARAATALVEGETLQASAVKNNNFTSEIYMRIIALKTAALFEASAELGARLAQADEQWVQALRKYAFNIGLAFQIIDDILDIIGDEQILGKTSGIDIEQGRGFASIQEQTDSSDEQSTAKLDAMESVKRKLLSGDRIQKARDQAEQFVEMAINELDDLPDTAAKAEMIELAHQVVHRQN